MAKKYKYKKPKVTSSMSTMPVIYLERSAVESFNMVAEMTGRMERGRELFLLEIAGIVIKGVKSKGVKVKIGNEDVDYAKDLRIAIVDGVSDYESVAIYFENSSVKLEAERLADTVLFVRALPSSPKWVDALIRFGPWPAELLPVHVMEKDAKLISRKARQDEIRAFADRIYDRRQEIERLLMSAGAKDPSIDSNDNAKGTIVNEDVGYNVIRKEFGFDGEGQEAHWRPALNMLEQELPLVMQKFIDYLETGRETVFDIPDKYGEISKSAVMEGMAFQKELAPFL
jgi:hypothetical protein